MNRILILSHASTDLSDLILQTCPDSAFCSFAEANGVDLDAWDALAILGGSGTSAYTLPAALRTRAEKFANAGKPVFCEFLMSFGCFYASDPESMTHHRLLYHHTAIPFSGLEDGDILDGHHNDCLTYYFVPENAAALLTYHDYLCAHDHLAPDTVSEGRRALWFAASNILVSAFRLCNFRRARLAPEKRWQSVISAIITFLSGKATTPVFPEPVCTFPNSSVSQAIGQGLNWFRNADMLIRDGEGGVKEGFSHHIRAGSGEQLRADTVRADCSGETGGAFLLDWMRTGNPDSLRTFQNIESFIFNYMQIKDGPHKGMLRWSETAWMTCYQDDVARAIMPTLLYQNFAGESSPYFAEAIEACAYMVSTTGPNGLREYRTDCADLTEERMEKLRQENTGITSAHYNAYYHAALLLCYRAGGPETFLQVAENGLSSIMAIYPNNTRETSETEEMCRLIFPLAVLYEITGKAEHLQWLHKVTDDLQKVRHPSGGYMEWDTGYQANCSRREAGECALLAENGDPVVDLLYSMNWLPLGFSYAYLATGEEQYRNLWQNVAEFFAACQICSSDPLLNGAWTRAFDVSRWETYGVPHDVGWAPCCIESGWTVGEILMGLQFMEIVNKRK